MTLVATGSHMATWVNGRQVSDWTDTRPADANPRKGLRLEAGTLSLQGHDPTTDLLFRALKIAEVPMRPALSPNRRAPDGLKLHEVVVGSYAPAVRRRRVT